MKKILCYILFLASLISCHISPEKSQKLTSVDNQETSPSIDYQHVLDSFSSVKNDLEIEIELLKKKFDYKQQDFNGRSYYHKNWWGHYYISDQAILAGVDSIGNFFIIANVWTYSYLSTNLDLIQIRIDTTNYFAKSDTSFSFIKPLDIICACGFHQAYFTNIEAQVIGREVSQNQDKQITWVGIKTLTKRDKVGIKETFDLSEKLRHIIDVENQIELINQQLKKNKPH